jgi:hypothetical protein
VQYRYVTQAWWYGRGHTKKEEEMITLMFEKILKNT